MAKSKKTGEESTEPVVLLATPPNFVAVKFRLVGTAPYCQQKYSEKMLRAIAEKQQEGDAAKSKRKRPPRDFDADYRAACYVSTDGWPGVPAGAFRSAMIDACRACGVVMSRARVAILGAVADGVDADWLTPLVRIHGTPRMSCMPMKARRAGVDIRVRPIWDKWHIDLTVKFDRDMISIESIHQLLVRAGQQVGIGEGRPASRESCGCGWGTFDVVPAD